MAYRETRLKHGAPGPARRGAAGDLRAGAGRTRYHRRAARRHPSLAPGASTHRPEVGRQRLPQPRGGFGRAHHRRAGAQGAAPRRCHGQPQARQLHRQHRRRHRRRRARRWPSSCARPCAASAASSWPTRSSSWATGPTQRRAHDRTIDDAARPRMTLPPTAIAVLLGGPSAEHDVSLVSGRAIATALLERGHDVTGWLLDARGRLVAPARSRRSTRRCRWRPSASPPPSAPTALWRPRPRSRRWPRPIPGPVVFPALHGPFGEDGQLQSLLESAGLVYCGAGPAASAVGMDKTLFKRVVGTLELPVLPWAEVRAAEYAGRPRARSRTACASSPPASPIRASSSSRPASAPASASPSSTTSTIRTLRGGPRGGLRATTTCVLVEPYLDHPRELETAVMGNSRLDAVAYGPARSGPGSEFYDYEAKYHSRRQRHRRAGRPRPRAGRVRSARRPWRSSWSSARSGFARVDMLLSADGIPYISEINTLPGFTPISLFPRMTALGGYDFAGTCERIVELALERAAGASATASCGPTTCREPTAPPGPMPAPSRPARRSADRRGGDAPTFARLVGAIGLVLLTLAALLAADRRRLPRDRGQRPLRGPGARR